LLWLFSFATAREPARADPLTYLILPAYHSDISFSGRVFPADWFQKVQVEAMNTHVTTAAMDERVERRQLEKSVSLTGRERLRCLWYRVRLTVAEMNYATRRLAELQARLP
jgi:hypothetical protein